MRVRVLPTSRVAHLRLRPGTRRPRSRVPIVGGPTRFAWLVGDAVAGTPQATPMRARSPHSRRQAMAPDWWCSTVPMPSCDHRRLGPSACPPLRCSDAPVGELRRVRRRSTPEPCPEVLAACRRRQPRGFQTGRRPVLRSHSDVSVRMGASERAGAREEGCRSLAVRRPHPGRSDSGPRRPLRW